MSSEYGNTDDWYLAEIDKLESEIERLRELVIDAFAEGYSAGFYEESNPGDCDASWEESRARKELQYQP